MTQDTHANGSIDGRQGRSALTGRASVLAVQITVLLAVVATLWMTVTALASEQLVVAALIFGTASALGFAVILAVQTGVAAALWWNDTRHVGR